MSQFTTYFVFLCTRVMYDRVRNREKIILKFPPFCKSNKENEEKNIHNKYNATPHKNCDAFVFVFI